MNTTSSPGERWLWSARIVPAHNTATGAYSLKVMTVVAVVLLPVVLAYQSWTYYVFRRRVSKSDFEPRQRPAEPSPGLPGKT